MDTLLPQIRALIPIDKDVLLKEIHNINELGGATRILLNKLLENFYSSQINKSLSISKILLDIIWEKLNTGHWKDVHLSWRLSYSVVSFIKGLSECIILTKNESSNLQSTDSTTPKIMPLSPRAIVKTCDMGLLMGAPILNNLLAKLAKAVQIVFLKNDDTEHDTTSDKNSQKINNTTMESKPEYDMFGKTTEKQKTSCDEYMTLTDAGSTSENDNHSILKKRKLCESLEDDTLANMKPCDEILHLVCPSLDAFKRDHMELKRPVVIEKGIDYWPALTTRMWSLEYIRQLSGYRTVPIEIGSRYTEDSWTQKLMTVGEFIDIFIERKKGEKHIGYLAQHQLFDQIPELRDDISIPTYCSISDEMDEDVDINAWFGPKGTISPLHFDPKHNLLCQVVGEKYIRLYAEEDTPRLYPHSGRLLNNTSQVDVEKPDLNLFPKFEKAKFLECVLKPGEMLYIPPRCWHYVRSLDISFSVSFWWI